MYCTFTTPFFSPLPELQAHFQLPQIMGKFRTRFLKTLNFPIFWELPQMFYKFKIFKELLKRVKLLLIAIFEVSRFT